MYDDRKWLGFVLQVMGDKLMQYVLFCHKFA